jgi:hypothetical protein
MENSFHFKKPKGFFEVLDDIREEFIERVGERTSTHFVKIHQHLTE